MKVSVNSLTSNLARDSSFAAIVPIEKAPAEVASSIPGLDASAVASLVEATSTVTAAQERLTAAASADAAASAQTIDGNGRKTDASIYISLGGAAGVLLAAVFIYSVRRWLALRRSPAKVAPFNDADAATNTPSKEGRHARVPHSSETSTRETLTRVTRCSKESMGGRTARSSKESMGRRTPRASKEYYSRMDSLDEIDGQCLQAPGSAREDDGYQKGMKVPDERCASEDEEVLGDVIPFQSSYWDVLPTPSVHDAIGDGMAESYAIGGTARRLCSLD